MRGLVAVSHRRSLSEEIGLAAFPPHTTPSDKARHHSLSARSPMPLSPMTVSSATPTSPMTVSPTVKHVGESMCWEDPHYRPKQKGAPNPFTALTRLRGVKKIVDASDKGEWVAHAQCAPREAGNRNSHRRSKVAARKLHEPFWP